MFTALNSRNFRLYYFGQGVSFIGNLIQEIALSWFIYRITGEAFYVGLLFFMKQMVAFLLSPLAGVLADRISMRIILIITNLTMLLMAFAMSMVVWKSYNPVFWILFIQGINGAVSGIDVPVRQAFVKDLVIDHSQLINAIALNSSLFNIARICSPMLAAFLIPLAGEAFCMLINSVTFLTVIVGLFTMRSLPVHVKTDSISILTDIREGLVYTLSHSSLRKVMAVTAIISLFGFPYTILLPAFTKEVLHGNVQMLGFLTTAIGVGSLLSGIYMATRKNTAGLQVLICFACMIYGLGLMLLAGVSTLSLAILVLVQIGLGQVLIFSSCNSILQTISDPRMTGRVVSFYIMAFTGATTLGYLLIGKLGDYAGPATTLIVSGVGSFATAVYLLLSVSSIKKRIYVTLRIRKNFRKYAVKELSP